MKLPFMPPENEEEVPKEEFYEFRFEANGANTLRVTYQISLSDVMWVIVFRSLLKPQLQHVVILFRHALMSNLHFFPII